jgi:hypothetical protein
MLKPLQPEAIQKIIFAVSESDFKDVKKNAEKYTRGNISAWMRHCVSTCHEGLKKKKDSKILGGAER